VSRATEHHFRLARRLLEVESVDVPGIDAGAANRVLEKLNRDLAGLVGPIGVHALQGRALRLAQRDHAVLGDVQLDATAEGELEGIRRAGKAAEPDVLRAGLVALVGHLIGLLASLIGEDLTFRLLKRVWPDMALDDSSVSGEGMETND
jgi:hypothetical protein